MIQLCKSTPLIHIFSFKPLKYCFFSCTVLKHAQIFQNKLIISLKKNQMTSQHIFQCHFDTVFAPVYSGLGCAIIFASPDLWFTHLFIDLQHSVLLTTFALQNGRPKIEDCSIHLKRQSAKVNSNVALHGCYCSHKLLPIMSHSGKSSKHDIHHKHCIIYRKSFVQLSTWQ